MTTAHPSRPGEQPAGTRSGSKRKHPVDQVPPAGKLAALGFQHVVAFYAGAVLVPLLIANAIKLDPQATVMLISADLFTCGIASILQSVGLWKIGVRLPLLQGVTFACLAPVIKIANSHGGARDGLLFVYGAVIFSGIILFLIAPLFSRLIKFFPPVVTGSVITIIGVSLLPVGIGDAISAPQSHTYTFDGKLIHGSIADASNYRWLLYALGTIVLIVIMQRFLKGFLGTIAVLLGIVVMTLVAWAYGDASFGGVSKAGWVGFTPPFAFGAPRFDVVAIVSMTVVLLVVAVESTGSVLAIGEIVGKRIKRDDITATVRADGFATVIGGSFNSFPYTAFSENVGLVRLTGVKSRWVVATAGVIMMVLGLLPKTAKIVESVPHPILGGASIVLFATVAIVGIQTLGKVDFTDHRNLIIASTALGLALYVEQSQSTAPKFVMGFNGTPIQIPGVPGIDHSVPGLLQIPFSSGITMGAICAILLNVLFFHIGSRGPAVAGKGSIHLGQVNSMTQAEFRDTFGGLSQGVTWVADHAYEQRPFADVHYLRIAFEDAMLTGSDEEKLELMQAFPDLGAEDDEGRLVARDHAGLENLEKDKHDDIVDLSEAYREHFGFPLIICARETERYERILRNGWTRMENSLDTEKAFALIEIAKIANYRFQDLVADANPIAAARFKNRRMS